MPGARIYLPERGLPQDTITLTGRWTANGSSAIATQTPPAAEVGFTVARTGVGTALVTLDDTYTAITDVHADAIETADSAVKCTAITDGTTATNSVALKYYSGGSAAEWPSNVQIVVTIKATTHSWQ